MNGKRTVIALFATGAVVAMLVALMPSVSAQAAAFGTQVKYGDNDFIPTIRTSGNALLTAPASPSSQLNVTRVDYGTAGDVTDDCFYLRKDNTTATLLQGTAQPAVRTYDIRIVVGSGCSGKTIGSLVQDTETAEKGQLNVASNTGGACPAATAAACSVGALGHRSPRVAYADVNNNNRYDLGDCVFITAGPRSNFVPANNQAATLNVTTNSAYTIRVTACAGKAAGSLVFSGDPDQVSYGAAGGLKLIGGATGLNMAIGIFDADNSGAFTPGDRFYLNTTAAAAASGASQLIPLYSIRIVADAGQFGSQVKFGDADFKPLMGITAGLLAHVARVQRVDYGTAGDVTDDCFYMAIGNNAVAGAGTIGTYDIRLVIGSGCSGKTVGSLVQDTESAEKGQANVTTLAGAAVGTVYADVNNNGRYDMGDCLYLTRGAANGAATGGPLNATTNTAFTIRMTACSGKAAGTLVFSGDPDFTSYGATGARNTGLSTSRGFGVGVFDADASGGFTPGDRLYINATSASGLVPLYAVRVIGDTGQFGSQVKFGETDFIPTIGTAAGLLAHVTRVQRVDYGTAGDVTDDCFYMGMGNNAVAGAGTIGTYDVRLVIGAGCSGKTIGSLVQDTESSEKGQANVTTLAGVAVGVVYADVNNNGRYDLGDCVFISRGAANGAATGGPLNATTNTAFTVRATGCSGKAAGTLVFSGDPDFTSYGATGARNTGLSTSRGMGVAIFDADRSGTYTPGDRLYLNTTVVGTFGLVPQYAVRLVGDFTTGGGGGPATGMTSTTSAGTGATSGATGTGATSGTSGTSSSARSSSAASPPATTTKKTPGLELVAVVAGVAAVVAVVSRKHK